MPRKRFALALAAVGCSPPAAAAPADPPPAVTEAAPATSSPAPVAQPALHTIAEAPRFEAFFRDVGLVCSRAITIEHRSGVWAQAYEAVLPAVSPAAREQHFRARASQLGLQVAESTPGLLTADDEAAGVGASLNATTLMVLIRLPGSDESARMAKLVAREPDDIRTLVAGLGGVPSVLQLRVSDGAGPGHDLLAKLAGSAAITEADVAKLARSVGLEKKDEGVYGTPDTPEPQRVVGLAMEKDGTLLLFANERGTKGRPECQERAE